MEEYLRLCLKNAEEEKMTKSSSDRPLLSQGLSLSHSSSSCSQVVLFSAGVLTIASHSRSSLPSCMLPFSTRLYLQISPKSRRKFLHLNRTTTKTATKTTTKMSPLISLTCSLPGSPTFNPRHLGFLSECPVNPKVPVRSLHLTSHHPPASHIITNPSSTTSPPRPIITTHGPGRIHPGGLPLRPTAPGPGSQELLGFPQSALRLCGVGSTWRSLLMRGGPGLRQAEHQAQKEREMVEAGAGIYPRSWTLNQVGKHNRKHTLTLFHVSMCTYATHAICYLCGCSSSVQ